MEPAPDETFLIDPRAPGDFLVRARRFFRPDAPSGFPLTDMQARRLSILSYLPRLGLATLLVFGAACSSTSSVSIDGDRRGTVTRFYQDLWSDEITGPRLLLTRMDKAGRLLILAGDLDIPAQIQDADPLPYSENASGAVWVGTGFPFDKAVKLIGWSRNYYTGLRYVALSDYVDRNTRRFDQDLYIGGSTETAVTRLNLTAWTESDWRALSRVGSQEAFHDLIRSRYPAEAAP